MGEPGGVFEVFVLLQAYLTLVLIVSPPNKPFRCKLRNIAGLIPKFSVSVIVKNIDLNAFSILCRLT